MVVPKVYNGDEKFLPPGDVMCDTILFVVLTGI